MKGQLPGDFATGQKSHASEMCPGASAQQMAAVIYLLAIFSERAFTFFFFFSFNFSINYTLRSFFYLFPEMQLPSSNSSLPQIRYSGFAILIDSARDRQPEGSAFLLHQFNHGGALEFLC